MTELRKRMIEDMTLAGLCEGTQSAYVCAVKQLALHYGTSPDLLTEQQVRQYLLDLIGVRNAPKGTFVCKVGGIRFFYTQTLLCDWPLFSKKNFAPRGASACRCLLPMAILSG